MTGSLTRLAFSALLAAALAACSGPYRANSPPRVDVPEPGRGAVSGAGAGPPASAPARPEAPGAPTVRSVPAPNSAPIVESGSTAAPPVSDNTAVNALLARAEAERRGGELDAAIAAAERALRIAPDDPAVYLELASLRLERGENALAEQLARKGLSYQPGPELRDRLLDVLERARRGLSG